MKLRKDIHKFVVKHYSDEERPIIKGNGFDGLEIGETKEDSEDFIEFINELIEEHIKRSQCQSDGPE